MISTQVGDYVLLKELGPGSLGMAYLAEHTFLKRRCVLKILPEELVRHPDFIARFQQHIAHLSQLDHPHIAKIHNATHVDGLYFVVSDAVLDAHGESISLAHYLRKKHHELSEEEIFRIASQLAQALDYAHSSSYGEESLAHGMIKLNNISIKEGSEGLHLVLTDFGLAKIIGPAAVFSRTLYNVSKSLGQGIGIDIGHAEVEHYTPVELDKAAKLRHSFCQNFAFMAPEQKTQAIVHPQSDVYAFGVLLYYLLLGEFPEGYFDLPSKRLGELKWNWDLLICKCLQTDPLKRPDLLSEKLDELLVKPSSQARQQLQRMRNVAEEGRPVLRPQEIVRPAFDADPGAVFQIDTAVAPYRPKMQEHREIEPLLIDMAVVPAGTYYRGSNHGARDEMPRHAIHLASFAIDIHPVTNEQFVRFLEAMGGEKDVNNNDIIRLREARIKRSGGSLLIESGYAKHPVVGVTWYGAIAYTKWIGKRLPTEAEWEAAAYGGREDFVFPTGENIERAQANYFSSDTTPIMSYPANGYGLFDVAGNVYEWCQDWYDYHYYDISVQEPDNPKGPHQGVYRVLRGGCWKSSKEDLRCAHRHRNNPGVMNGTYGFRCAADVMIET